MVSELAFIRYKVTHETRCARIFNPYITVVADQLGSHTPLAQDRVIRLMRHAIMSWGQLSVEKLYKAMGVQFILSPAALMLLEKINHPHVVSMETEQRVVEVRKVGEIPYSTTITSPVKVKYIPQSSRRKLSANAIAAIKKTAREFKR